MFAEPLKMLLVPVSSCLCVCIPVTCLRTWGRASFMYPVLKVVFRVCCVLGTLLETVGSDTNRTVLSLCSHTLVKHT